MYIKCSGFYPLRGMCVLLFAVVWLMGNTVYAQSKVEQCQIKGRIVDSADNKDMAFTTLSLLKLPDKTVEQKLISTEKGMFQISANKGNYQLQIYSLGYKLKTIDINTLDFKESEFDLGNIGLSMASTTLNTVEIVAEKPLVTVEADKISYNIDSDPDSKTMNALEMLRKVPMVSVDGEDNVQLKGSSNFKFLLNGKESTMLSSNSKDFLKSLPASAVKNIEVITSPGAKYDAEGVGGIINIVTQSKDLKGYTCSVNLGANTVGEMNGGIYAAASIKKFVFSTSLYYNTHQQPWHESIGYRENNISTEQRYTNDKGEYKYEGKYPYNNTELSYEIDSLNLISASFDFWNGINSSISNGSTRIYDINYQLAQAYNTNYDYDYNYGSIDGTIDYQKVFRRNKEQILTLSYKLSSGSNANETLYSIDSIYNFAPIKKRIDTKSSDYEHTYQIDYVHPIKKLGSIEVGSKYIKRLSSSNSEGDYYQFETDEYLTDYSEFTDFDYSTDIIAGYTSFTTKVGKFGFSPGVRIENAITKGEYFTQENTKFQNESIEYVPTIRLSYQINQTQSLRLTYNKRIQRPSIWHLNPNIDDNNPKSISFGNPNLKPEHFHNFEINYSFFSKFGNINFSSSYSQADNGIDRFVWLGQEDILYATFKNISKIRSYTQSLFSNLNFSKKLIMGINASAIYNDVESNTDENISNNGWGYRSNGWIRYTIIKGLNISAYGGYYKHPASLQSSYSAYDYSGINLSKAFLKDKLTMSFGVNDFYKSERKWEYERWTEYVYQKNKSYRPGRSFRFGVSFRFGELNKQIQKANKSINNDDVKQNSENNGNSNG